MRILDELALDGERLHRIGGKDLCALLSLSSGALTDLKKRGIAVHLGHDAYDLEATVRAYVMHLRGIAAGWGSEEQALNLTGERARLSRAQAEAQEMKNAALRAELVPAAEVERAWADTLRQVRARILAVPSRLRQGLHLAPGDVEQIDRELRDALTELANGDA
ncbi:hypothetical protein [Rhodobacter ferrooxidans]|uniref:DNA packaging protein n=1 Tax=Rhodobacter ferrooxidans TaxID=371731 RepID=C8S4V1_9RHOB|nr:hypothetical protein [Rhodobacter sp. SW2]EEW24010.1 conserved hypothetical protein [Rhodobacter sp. SW2]